MHEVNKQWNFEETYEKTCKESKETKRYLTRRYIDREQTPVGNSMEEKN